MYDLLIRRGCVVTETGSRRCDIAAEGGKIREVASGIKGPATRTIDASGLLVLPGLVDPHVHFGLETKGTKTCDDAESGTVAALHGGVTTVIDFTSQRPGQRLVESLKERLASFNGISRCDYALHVNVTDFPQDFERTFPDDLDRLSSLGAASLKVFTAYSREGMSISERSLRFVLRVGREKGFQVLVHAEDDRAVAEAEGRLLEAGSTSVGHFPLSRPGEAEARAIEDVCLLAREVDAPVYFVHVSTGAGAAAIRTARGLTQAPIYMETCPQYLLLDESKYVGGDGAQYLVAPPLRGASDRSALLEALARGEVDVVATDHCAFKRRQKDRPGAPFLDLPNGLPGVETRLSLLHTIAREHGRIDLPDIVRVTASNPARIFGLYPRKGCIGVGSDADLVLFDPEAEWRLAPDRLHMITDFSPYQDQRVVGKVLQVFRRGIGVVPEEVRNPGALGKNLRRGTRPPTFG